MGLLTNLFRRPPDFIVGGKDNPYLLRWWIIPRNPIFNIYLHKFLRDDDDRALHDHPWCSLSITLKGKYIEHLPQGRKKIRVAGNIVFRRATHRHRIELYKCVRWQHGFMLISKTKSEAVWTLFITGIRIREWGFWCKSGDGFRFVHWEEFTSPEDKGKTGKGCN